MNRYQNHNINCDSKYFIIFRNTILLRRNTNRRTKNMNMICDRNLCFLRNIKGTERATAGTIKRAVLHGQFSVVVSVT